MGGAAYEVEDVWRFIDKREDDECWPWIGFVNRGERYGRLTIRGRGYRPHRIVYFLAHPDEGFCIGVDSFHSDTDVILHSCDNTFCCNPRHLSRGKPRDNTRDMIQKGRKWKNAGELHPLAKLNAMDVGAIRDRRSRGESLKSLAAEFGVADSTICGIARKRWYKSVN